MTISKEAFNNATKSAKNRVQTYSDVTRQSLDAANAYLNATATELGLDAGQIRGGIEGLTSEFDNVTSELQAIRNINPVEGLLTEEIQGVTNLINQSLNKSVSEFSSGVVTGVSISYDSDGEGNIYPIGDSSGGDDILDISSLIGTVVGSMTGLGQGGKVGPGFAQSIIANASPTGISDALKSLDGKIGAFDSAFNAQVTAQVNDALSTLQAETQVGAGDEGWFNRTVNSISDGLTDFANTLNEAISVVDVSPTVGGISGATNVDEVLKNIENNVEIKEGVVIKATGFQELVSSTFKEFGGGLAQAIAEVINPNGAKNILGTVSNTLTETEQNQVILLSQGNPSEREQASKILQSKSNLSPAESRELLNKLNTTIAGSIVVDTKESAFLSPFEMGTESGKWNNGVGAAGFKFTFINSFEELEAELRSIRRPITETVVHWSETFTNKNIGSDEINQTHIDFGLDGIGYHYVIRRDGSLQRGRPVGDVGQHSTKNGHDKNSIGICFVGGLNCPSGTPNAIEYRSARSLTRSQMLTFEMFCRAFYYAYPGGQIIGHNDIDISQFDPGFDVRDYVENLFGKKSLFTDTFNQPPFEVSELNAKRLSE